MQFPMIAIQIAHLLIYTSRCLYLGKRKKNTLPFPHPLLIQARLQKKIVAKATIILCFWFPLNLDRNEEVQTIFDYFYFSRNYKIESSLSNVVKVCFYEICMGKASLSQRHFLRLSNFFKFYMQRGKKSINQ